MARAKSAAATGEKKTTTRGKKTAAPSNGSTVEVGTKAPETNVEERIRVRAYELYESRGRQHGAHESDWYKAEAEVRSRTA
jgi:hypothetical protein